MTIKDITPERNATAEELRQYEAAKEKLGQLNSSGTFDANDPNQRLFLASFDGTKNDRDSTDPDYVHTNPDMLEKLIDQSNSSIVSKYIPGVGTGKDAAGNNNVGLIDKLHEQITGDGSKDRAEYAYTQLVAQVQAWQQENPGVEVHVSTVGFSRGTATQRQFANLVAERDTYLQTMRRWHQVFSIKAGAGATRKKSLRSESLDSPAALVAPV